MDDPQLFAILFISFGLIILVLIPYRSLYRFFFFFLSSYIKSPPRALLADYKDGHVELTWHPPSGSLRNIVVGYVVRRYTYENHKVRDRPQGWVMDFTTEIDDLEKYVDNDPTKDMVHAYEVWPLDKKRRRGPAARTRDIHIKNY